MAIAQTNILVARWSDALLLWPLWIPPFVAFAIVGALTRRGQPSKSVADVHRRSSLPRKDESYDRESETGH